MLVILINIFYNFFLGFIFHNESEWNGGSTMQKLDEKHNKNLKKNDTLRFQKMVGNNNYCEILRL